jgi:hypothetical protein
MQGNQDMGDDAFINTLGSDTEQYSSRSLVAEAQDNIEEIMSRFVVSTCSFTFYTVQCYRVRRFLSPDNASEPM